MALREYQVSDDAVALRDFICRLIEADVIGIVKGGDGVPQVAFYSSRGKFDRRVRSLMERLVEIAQDG